MTEAFNERRLEQELLTTEMVQERFIEKLASIKADIITHDGPYNKEFRYTAPDGFGHIIRFTDGRTVLSSTFGPNEPIRHSDKNPFVMTSLHGTIISAVDVDLALHASDKLFRNNRAAYYHENGGDILDLVEVETVVDNGPFPAES